MPCYSPLKAYRSKRCNPSGKRPIVFQRKDAFVDLELQVPCGQCIGCRLEKSRQWAVRATHEASLYLRNCFVTLTYDDESLPENSSLDLAAPVAFMKRLRKKYGEGIRSFGCGEYGEKFQRPHYHICLFNHDFPDKKLWQTNNGNKLYVSESLKALWPYGFSTIGPVNFETAAYVARYVTKKITGKKAALHYGKRQPEKAVCISRNPGLAKPWFDKFSSDVYPDDFVVVRGKKMRPPHYYDYRFELDSSVKMMTIKRRRKTKMNQMLEKTPDQRLEVHEAVVLAKIKNSKRTFENED